MAIVKLEKIVKQKDDIIIELEKTKANLEEEMKTMNLQIEKLNRVAFNIHNELKKNTDKNKMKWKVF